MSSDPISLTLMARNKMHSSFGGKDACSLHRWVLLKNCLTGCPPRSILNPTPSDSAGVNQLPSIDGHSQNDHSSDETSAGHGNSFLFPDAGKLVSSSQSSASEAQWLDTLLKELAEDEDEDDLVDADVLSSSTPVDEEEEDAPLSPLISPMGSSDDLHLQTSLYSSTISNAPYPVPYPHYHAPLVHHYTDINTSISSLPAPYEDPLPYYSLDDSQDDALPDTILEDTSDDESDTPSTPSFGSSSTSLMLYDSPSTSPTERTTRHPKTHLYSIKDTFFCSYEADPLPFPNEHHTSYNAYQRY